ncbi:AraC-binding-like domain-containing protein [Geodermatophilus dictyosporus]|uniref:AraC-binding-like domain-containing protein n=1 Tax=Geodermatophilus dictyosporus TaxID=1523247 RepID=A0A1I5NHQ0_9ACTN|nr:helix-turn-helix transcriptional regulator [Geodermatophilus dictyosporus]SFP21333.1 AraC-binding-like domain-containing protein [Geodermatophilus dictyosporus]
MSTSQTHPGLVQRSSFSSSDETAVTEFIRRMYADNTSRFAPIRNGAQFSALTHDTPVLGADRVRTSIDYSGTSGEGFSDYVFFVVHAGSVQICSRGAETVAAGGDVALYPLGVSIDFVMHGFDVTTVRLPAERMEQVAEDTAGVTGPELRFSGTTPVSPSMHRFWRSLVGLVSGALMDPVSPLDSPLLAEEMARAVATAALHVFPNTTLSRQHVPGPGAVAPAAVRRAVAHIEAHAHLPLKLDEIAAAAGTSARALQYGFRRHLDTTPTGYLRRVRLEGARRELQRADPTRGDTVAAVARRWGFAKPDRFAAAYRTAHGVPPSHTLRT